MRFLQSEHNAIQEAIHTAGFAAKDFSSAKRQGKLHMFYRDHPTPFKFFRKKTTRLNASGKWEQQTVYQLYPEGKMTETDQWEGVMEAFCAWMDTL